jgi:hypothetical protein
MEVEERLTMVSEISGSGQPLQGLPGADGSHSATVPATHAETEVGVVGEQQWRAIQERHAAGQLGTVPAPGAACFKTAMIFVSFPASHTSHS